MTSTELPARAATGPTLPPGRRRRDGASTVFVCVLWACLLVAALFLFYVLITIVVSGVSRLDANLITQAPSTIRPATAGVQPAIVGTLLVVGVTALIALPLGIAAAIYLEEYADPRRWFNRAIELNVQNLAAVPSIIFGLLGLAVFLWIFPNFRSAPLIGGMTLAHAVALGPLLAVGAVLGDLVESVFKRDSGVKDSGSFFPGIGGILDLLDSLLFNAPLMFLYLRLVLFND